MNINVVAVEVIDHQTDYIRSYQTILNQDGVMDNDVLSVAIDMIQAEVEGSYEWLLEKWGKLVDSKPTIDEIKNHLMENGYPVRLSVSNTQIEL